MYRIEDTQSAIKELQRLLGQRQSGIYNDATRRNVLAAQAKYSLEETGVADYHTFTKITEEYRKRKTFEWKNDILFRPRFPFSPGDFGDNEAKINSVLALVLAEYSYEGIPPRGSYIGDDTVSGVIYLKKIFGMSETTDIEEDFLNRLLSEKRAIELKREFGI